MGVEFKSLPPKLDKTPDRSGEDCMVPRIVDVHLPCPVNTDRGNHPKSRDCGDYNSGNSKEPEEKQHCLGVFLVVFLSDSPW